MARAGEVRRGKPRWRAITWLVAFAFTLQSFVTQTHIHVTPQVAGSAAIVKLLDRASAEHKAPVEKDKTTCPFCQAIARAGAFFASVAPLLPLPVTLVKHAIPALLSLTVHAPPAHSWQSRAPPQH